MDMGTSGMQSASRNALASCVLPSNNKFRRKNYMRMITFPVFDAISNVLDCPTNTNEAEKCSDLDDISFDRTDEIIRMSFL